ncbi:MAG: tetratricopeptide repeat protein [Muribaculaceae bacterium]
MNNLTPRLTLLLCSFFTSLCFNIAAQDAEFDQLMQRFDHNQTSAQAANDVFAYVEKVFPGDEPIHFAAGTPVDSLRQQVWYWGAEVQNELQNYQSAKDLALRSLPYFRYDNLDKAYCLKLVAIVCVRLAEFESAADYGKQALTILLKVNDPDEISSILNVLAGTYMAADQPQEAEHYILKGLDYADQANNPARKAILLGMASEVYHKLGRDAEAVDYASQAFALDSAQGRMPRAAIRLSQKAAALIGLEDYAQAEATLRRAIPMLTEAGNSHSVAISLNQLGLCLIHQHKHADAIPHLRQAAQMFEQMGDLYNLTHSHQALYNAYWDINSDSARIELERFNALRDSLYSTATAESLARFKAEFDTDQLAAENQQIRAAHRRDICIGIAIVAVLIIVGLLIARRTARRHRLAMQQLIAEVDQIREQMSTPTVAKPVEAPATQSDDQSAFLQRVVEAVEQGLANGQADVAHIAAALHLTEQTFRRRLRDATGQQPKMFISAIQMERAADTLMLDTNRPISEVALLCGFDDASAFSHAFKRVYGVSPTQYRLNATTK